MKLHLPTRLRSALLACLSAVAVLTPTLATGCIGGGIIALALANRAVAATLTNKTFEYNGTTYSGAALVTLDVALQANAGYGTADGDGKNISEASMTIGDTQVGMSAETALLNNDGNSTAAVLWNNFCSGKGNSTYGQTLRMAGAASGSTQRIKVDFLPFTLGGFITEGEGSYQLTRTNDDSKIIEFVGNGSAHVTINADTTFTLKSVDHGVSVKTSGNWVINRNLTFSDTDIALPFTIGTDDAANAVTMNVSGTGTLAINGNTTVKAGSTLQSDAATTLNLTGNLTVNGAMTMQKGTLALGSSGITMGASSSLALGENAVLDVTNIAASGQDVLSEGANGFKLGKLFLQAGEGATVTGLTQVRNGETMVDVHHTDSGQYYTAVESDNIYYVGGTYTYDGTRTDISNITTLAGANLTLNAVPSGAVTISGNTELTVGADMTINDKVTISSGTLNLTVNNGATVVQSSSGSGGTNSYVNGAINITGNGTYRLTASDAFGLGAGHTVPPAINIEDGTLDLETTTQILGTPLNLNGNAHVTGDGSTDNAGISVFSNDNADTGSGLHITARNTGNDISAQIRLRHDLTITVDGAESDLTISGKVKDAAQPQSTHKATVKNGAGTLTFTHAENAFVGGFSNNAGTTVINGSAAFGGSLSEGYQALSIAAGSAMQFNAAVTANGAVAVNGDLTLGSNGESNGSLTLGNAATLEINKTIAGAGSSALTLGSNTTLSVTSTAMLDNAAPGDSQNGFADNVTYILAKGVNATGYEGKTVAVNSENKELAFADGNLTFTLAGTSGLYWVRTDGVTFADSGDMATATAFQVTSTGVLTLVENTVPGESVVITNAGTVNLQGNTTGLSKVANTAQGTVYLTDTNGGKALAFTGAFNAAAAPVFTVNDDTKQITSTSSANNTFTGDITIKSGYTLKLPTNADGNSFGPIYNNNPTADNSNSPIITVENGAVILNSSGNAVACYKLVLQYGATVRADGSTSYYNKSYPFIELDGNATVDVADAKELYSISRDHADTTLALDGHTLTKTGGGAFLLQNTAVTGAGIINIQDGRVVLRSRNNRNCSVAEATVKMGANGTLEVNAHGGSTTGTFSVFQITGTGTLQFANGFSLALGNGATASASHANTIRVGTAAGHTATLNLGAQATLSAPTTVENGTLTLTGSGAYDLGSSLAMTEKVSLADAWSGTVAAADAVVSADTDTTGMTTASSSLSINGLTVEGSSTALTLAANTVLHGTLQTANTITLAGALTLGDDFMLDLTNLAHTTVTGQDGSHMEVYTVFTGGGIDLGSMLQASQITGLEAGVGVDDLTINHDGTISYITSVPETVLPVTGDIVYDDTAAGNDAYTTIRLSEGGELAFGDNALNSHVTTLEAGGSGSVLSNGTVNEVSFETIDVKNGRTLTLAAGSAALTTKVTQSLTFGNDSSRIAVEQGQVLDVTALTPNIVSFTNNFISIANHVSGDGAVKIAGRDDFPDDAGDHNRLTLQTASGNITTSVNIDVTNSMAVNGSNADGKTLSLGKALTVENTLRLESGATVNVLAHGSIQAATIQLGHAIGYSGYPGHLTLADGGSITAGSIVSTVEDNGGNSLSMAGGTLALTTEGTTINGGTGNGQIATTITGGELKAETASWGISGATVGGTAANSVSITTSADKAITLTGTTLTATLNTDHGKLVLTGTQTIQDNGSFNTSEEGTSYFNASNVKGENGYKTTDRIYTIASNGAAEHLDVTGVTWSIATATRAAAPSTVEYTGNGQVTAYGVTGTDYYVNTTVTYDAGTEFANATKLIIASQDGTPGSLILAADLAGDLNSPAPDGGILVQSAGASLTINDDVTLAKSRLAIGTGASVSIKGRGMLTMTGNKVLATGLGGITMDATAGTGWTGTVRLMDSVGGSASEDSTANNLENLRNLGGAGGKVQLYNVAGYVSNNAISTNLELLSSADGSTATGADALTINNGSSNGTPEFSGAITGDGNFNMAWGVAADYTVQFSGDVSGWTGDCKVTSNSSNLRLIKFKGNATVVNADVIAGANATNTTVQFDNANNTVTMNGTVTANKLEATANTTLNLTKTVAVNTLAGAAGSTIAATHALNLKSGASTAAALSATGGLTLGAAAAGETAATHATLAASGALTLGNSLTLNGLNSFMEASPTGSMITADSLTLGSLSSFNINADLEGLESGDSLTLLSLTQAADDSIGVTLQGESGTEYVTDRYVYALAWNDDRTQLSLTVKAAGTDWVGAGTGDPAMADWSDENNWSSGFVPTDTGTALLGGAGAPVINVDAPEGGSIAVGSVTVDNTDAQGVDTPVENYTFTGGELTAEGKLQILHGGLTIDNATSFGGVDAGADAGKVGGVIESDGALAVGDGDAGNGSGSLTVGAADAPADLTNKGVLAVHADGALNVSGNLDSSTQGSTVTLAGGTATVGGTLSLSQETLDNASDLTAGTLAAAQTALTNRNSLTLGTEDGTASTLESITLAQDENGQYQDASLTIHGSGSALTLTEDSVLGTLENEGSINAGNNSLTLTQQTGNGGTLQAGSLTLEEGAAGSALTALTTGSIVFHGLTANNETTALSISGALTPATAGSPVELDLGDAARLEAGAYKLVSADGLAAGNVTVTEDYLQSVLREGLKGELSVDNGTASFEVAEQTGYEMTWNTSGNATNAGLQLTDINADPTQASALASYDSLKGVGSVNVDADRTLSLENIEPQDAQGLVLNNLQGDKTLTIIGNDKDADIITLASPALTNAEGDPVKGSFEKGTLALNKVSAWANDSQKIGTLELTDSNFLSNDLEDSAPFTEIGQLSGNEGSMIGGFIQITGTPADGAAAPAAYNGTYTEPTFMLLGKMDENGNAVAAAEQTLTPGQGLSLAVLPNSTAHLTDATKGKEMEWLLTGKGSVVDLGEAAVGDAGLTLHDGENNYIAGNVSFSMAAGDAAKGVVAIAGNNVTYAPCSSITITQTEAEGSMVMATVPTATTGIRLAQVGADSNSTANITLNGKLLQKYYGNARLSGNTIVVDRNTRYTSDIVTPNSTNGHAGAALLDDLLVTLNPQANRTAHPDLAALMDAVDSKQIRDTHAAAVAGASLAALGSAFSGDVERQLRAIRNRTTTMGVDQCQVNEDMPYFNAWVNAEGDYRKLEQDGTAAGYTLSSWGGTVGFDVDLAPSFTAGLAVTAMYGNMDTAAPDRAEGDFDTYYASVFARYASRAWTHTFVGSVGWLDASLDRTVSYPGGSYKTSGDTKGLGFGLMYEAGYVIPLNEDSTACLQPVFNVAWRHIGVDGFNETGDAGLRADDQSMDVVTFGLGARLQSAVAENIYNRTALFEARALLKVDAGDRRSDLDVGLLHGNCTNAIESAEVGAVGVELGAGLTIPVGAEGGSLFIDGSAELRDGYTNLNGTVGYRINF